MFAVLSCLPSTVFQLSGLMSRSLKSCLFKGIGGSKDPYDQNLTISLSVERVIDLIAKTCQEGKCCLSADLFEFSPKEVENVKAGAEEAFRLRH